MRMVALRSLGFDIQAIDSSVGRIRPLSQPLEYLAIKARRPLDTRRINQQILNAVGPCSVLYIDKGVTIRSATLAKVRAAFPHVRIIGYSPDDMLNRNMSSAYFPGTLPLYHTYLTTKSYGVQELLDLGCPQVLFVENAYDPDTHRPLPPANSPIFSCAVGFIGTYEPDRAAILKRLALAGIPVTIRGNLWRPLQWQAIAGLSFLPEVIGDEYSRAICSTRINLAFLRKSNRDLQTTPLHRDSRLCRIYARRANGRARGSLSRGGGGRVFRWLRRTRAENKKNPRRRTAAQSHCAGRSNALPARRLHLRRSFSNGLSNTRHSAARLATLNPSGSAE